MVVNRKNGIDFLLLARAKDEYSEANQIMMLLWSMLQISGRRMS